MQVVWGKKLCFRSDAVVYLVVVFYQQHLGSQQFLPFFAALYDTRKWWETSHFLTRAFESEQRKLFASDFKTICYGSKRNKFLDRTNNSLFASEPFEQRGHMRQGTGCLWHSEALIFVRSSDLWSRHERSWVQRSASTVSPCFLLFMDGCVGRVFDENEKVWQATDVFFPNSNNCQHWFQYLFSRIKGVYQNYFFC